MQELKVTLQAHCIQIHQSRFFEIPCPFTFAIFERCTESHKSVQNACPAGIVCLNFCFTLKCCCCCTVLVKQTDWFLCSGSGLRLVQMQSGAHSILIANKCLICFNGNSLLPHFNCHTAHNATPMNIHFLANFSCTPA